MDGHLSIYLHGKTSVNDCVEMLLSPCALISLKSNEKIQPKMMVATFNITIISCYSPTNDTDETDLIAFYNELYFLVRSIPKHNVPIIGKDMNAQIGRDEKTNSAHTTRQTEMGNIRQNSHLKID